MLSRPINTKREGTRNGASDLSPREQEVLYWLRQGKTSWAIAQILNISERTVNYHVSNIIGKLGVRNRVHAVAVATDLGICSFERSPGCYSGTSGE